MVWIESFFWRFFSKNFLRCDDADHQKDKNLKMLSSFIFYHFSDLDDRKKGFYKVFSGRVVHESYGVENKN